MSSEPRFFYGGQAVIEGVMIRGRRHYSLAVRRADGDVDTLCEPLNPLFTGAWRRIPFIRGILVLIETLFLGIKCLNRSAVMATADQLDDGEEMPKWVLAGTIVISMVFGIGLFFILPLFAVRAFDHAITSDILSNSIEGIIRLVVLVAYISIIGMMSDVRRVFAYHGAEHMAVHTHEAGLPLDVEHVRRFPTAHPRCGTAFLLTVMVVSILAFAFLGRPDLEWRIASRIVLIPAIAAFSYEIIRFCGAHASNPATKAVTFLGLTLQRLTTRQPNDEQIEVAIHAMETALAADEEREPQFAIAGNREGDASNAPGTAAERIPPTEGPWPVP